jgi:Putative Ig domain
MMEPQQSCTRFRFYFWISLIVLFEACTGFSPCVFAQTPVTALYYTGSPVSFVTGGKTATLTPADGFSFIPTFGNAAGNADYVAIQVNNFPINEYWTVRLAAPFSQRLTVGTYSNAMESSTSVNPGLEFDGDSRADDTVTGFFKILEIVVSNGQLVSFAADFTQYDEGFEASWTYGSIRYKSSIPLNVLPPPPIQTLSVACTNADGPTVKPLFYTYSSSCFASGGVGPYQWAIINGQLPAGLQMTKVLGTTSTIAISGQPAAPGPFSYSVQVTDSQNQTASQIFSGTTANTSCVPNVAYRTLPQSFTFTPSGGTQFLSFSFVSEGCPWTLSTDIPGVTFSPASGTTNGFGNYVTSTFKVSPNTDAVPHAGSLFLKDSGNVIMTFPIVVNSNSCIFTVSPSSAHFAAVGGAATLTVTSNPPGCRVYGNNSTPGGISQFSSPGNGVYYYWLPPNAGAARSGTTQFAAGSPGGTNVFSWDQDASDGSFSVGCYLVGPARVGSPIVTCSAVGGTAPYVWSVIEGSVPGGFPANAIGNYASVGNPMVPGPYKFTIRVLDSRTPNPLVATYKVTGTIAADAPRINCSSAAGPKLVGSAYAVACLASHGAMPYQWSIAGGALPSGLTLAPMEGGGLLISGIPDTDGDYNYTLQLADAGDPANYATQQFGGTIAPRNSDIDRFTMSCTSTLGFEIGVATAPIACAASGGVPGYHWSIHTGLLPPGVTLSSDTGNTIMISGIPTQLVIGGYFSSYLKVIDSSSVPQPRLWYLNLLVSRQIDFNCSPGSGQVGQTYAAPCSGQFSTAWISAGLLPPGLQLSTYGIVGTPNTPGTYNFTISVQDSYYPTPITTSHAYTITIGPSLPPLNTTLVSGSFAHLAFGAGWQSSTVLINPADTYARMHVGYFTDQGTALSLPSEISPDGIASVAAAVDHTLGAHSMLTIDSTAPENLPVQAGAAQLSSDGRVKGSIRFRYDPLDQDALIPLEDRTGAAYTLAFDNRAGIRTGVALANLTSVTATIPVVIRDDTGAQVGSTSVSIPAMGHLAFFLSDRFADTADRSGSIEFDTPLNGRISVLGLRFPPGGRFTTIPVIANTDPGGGALAHLAAGGGWSSTIELVNTGSTQAQAHLQFFADDGSPMPLALSVGGVNTTSATLDESMAPHQHLTIQSNVPDGSPVQTGSAQLTSDGSVSGFVRFGYIPQGEEAVVPLEFRNAGAYTLPFDNTGGVSTGVAISNLASTPATISAVIRNATGLQIGSGVIIIAGNGHSAFFLSARFLATVDETGTIEFDTPANGKISVLGLRFNASGAFSTIPVVVP